MHKQFNLFKEHKKRSRRIVLLFSLNLLFFIFSFIAVIVDYDKSRPFIAIFLFMDILLLLHTAMYSAKNLIIVQHLEEYFFNKNYGINYIRMHQFHKIIDEDLLTYHFQPIINARTGEIYSYEAFMRTDRTYVEMLPAEILDLAAKEDRLYDIEYLTFLHSLKIIKEHPEIFESRRLFINSISSHMLNDQDYNALISEYGSLFKNLVIELSEADKLSDQETELLSRLRNFNSQLALDEYGSSKNTDSILKLVNPAFLKIDRSVLRFINSDATKQKQLYEIIDLAKQNQIKTIAVGVENYDELEYLIRQGIDYVQGFYMAKPEPELLTNITENLQNKIHKINHKRISDNTLNQIYETNGETLLEPGKIAADHYSFISIYEKELVLLGSADETLDIFLVIPDNHNCTLTLKNLFLRSSDRPSITIGKNCEVTINLIGDNYLMCNGIRVPASASLSITGDGNLTIHADRSNRIGIGGTDSQSYGNITLASKGNINIFSSGNMSVAVGGGQNSGNSVISLVSGNLSIESFGYSTVGIGSLLGNARIIIDSLCSLVIKTEGTKAVSIGCILGFADIVTSGNLNIKNNGRNSVLIGSLEEGTGIIQLLAGNIYLKLNSHTGTAIGAVNGNFSIGLFGAEILISGDGAEIIALGDHACQSKIRINGGLLAIQIFSTNSLLTGHFYNKYIIDGGNIQCDFPANMELMNSYGTPLVPYLITDVDEFSHTIETVSYSYEYKALYSDHYPFIKVYLPENTIL